MIKRLRKKFILTNMLLVALVLITVFGVLVGYNYQRLVRQSEEAMRTALKWSDDAPPPVFQFGASHEEEMEEQGEERRFTMVPVFVVLLDEDGGPAQVTGGNNVEVSDQVVAQAVATATEESGAISGLNPRYLQDTDRGGEQPDRLCRYGLGDRLTVAADPHRRLHRARWERPGGGPPLLGQERRRKGDFSGHRACGCFRAHLERAASL